MGTILCSAIVDEAEVLLHDIANGKWLAADLFGWVKDAQKVASILKPDVSIQSSAVVCVAGVLQSITGHLLIDILYNMGTNGTTIGQAVTFIEMDRMRKINPDWTTETASATVDFVMYDPRDPKHFYTSPPQPTSNFGYLQIVQAIPPADPAAIGNAITLDDIWKPVLLDYTVYRALITDAPHTLYGKSVALQYFNNFVTMLDRADLRESIDSPKVKAGQMPQLPTSA